MRLHSPCDVILVDASISNPQSLSQALGVILVGSTHGIEYLDVKGNVVGLHPGTMLVHELDRELRARDIWEDGLVKIGETVKLDQHLKGHDTKTLHCFPSMMSDTRVIQEIEKTGKRDNSGSASSHRSSLMDYWQLDPAEEKRTLAALKKK